MKHSLTNHLWESIGTKKMFFSPEKNNILFYETIKFIAAAMILCKRSSQIVCFLSSKLLFVCCFLDFSHLYRYLPLLFITILIKN